MINPKLEEIWLPLWTVVRKEEEVAGAHEVGRAHKEGGAHEVGRSVKTFQSSRLGR